MNRTVKYQGAFSRIVGFASKRFLFSPPPSTPFFFRCHSNFRAITRLETLATQAKEKESKTVLDSGFRISGTEFQCLSVELGFWIAIVSRIQDSLSCIPDFKAHDFGFHQ